MMRGGGHGFSMSAFIERIIIIIIGVVVGIFVSSILGGRPSSATGHAEQILLTI